MMLTLQTATIISGVEPNARNGKSHSRYHGNTTGANKRDAAMGQANLSGDKLSDALLSQIAVANPASTASPTSNCGGAT